MSGTPINEAGITAAFAAIFARLDALEARTDGHTNAINAWVGVASSTAATVERLESARIAAPVAPESVETASEVTQEPGNATERICPNCGRPLVEGGGHHSRVEWAECIEVTKQRAEVAAALRMYRKVQGCKVGIALNARIQELGWVVDERDELRNRLHALEARRCDGCAHFALESKGQGECWSDVYETTAALPLVFVDHSCAAWTEKP